MLLANTHFLARQLTRVAQSRCAVRTLFGPYSDPDVQRDGDDDGGSDPSSEPFVPSTRGFVYLDDAHFLADVLENVLCDLLLCMSRCGSRRRR